MRLLLVEDEPLVRLNIADCLEDRGFIVDQAPDGQAAIKRLAGLWPPFSAIITDIRLGDGPDGWAVARAARRLRPHIPVIYMTGDSAADWAMQGVAGSVILRRPFPEEALLTRLALLLEGASAANRPASVNDNTAKGVTSWLYVSTSLLPPGSASAELDEIVAASRRRNAAAQVTGGIILAGNRFVQLIEGQAVSVAAIKASILRDPRHTGIETLFEGDRNERQFTSWALSYAGPSRVVERIIDLSLQIETRSQAVLSITRLLKNFSLRV